MNFATLLKAFNAAMVLGDAVKRLKGDPGADAADTRLAATAPPPDLPGQVEARLANVLVAALKEAFDRDHARLELERAQLDEQRQRAEQALRAELRRQAADREIGRLRLVAGTAIVGWIASVAVLVARLDGASMGARLVTAVAWLLLLGALGAAFGGQGRVGAEMARDDAAVGPGGYGAAALWLLIAGLAASAVSLLL